MSRKIRQHVLERLTVHERTPSGRARNYVDPITGELFTQRERQQGKTGLSIEAQSVIRKSGNLQALNRATARKESIGYLADRYRQKLTAQGRKITRTEILRDKKFWRDVGNLKREKGKERIMALVRLGVMSASYAATIIALYTDGDDTGDEPDDEPYDEPDND